MTCVMEIDTHGKVVKSDIGPAVIRVKRRCNYVEVRKALVDGIIPDDLQPFMPMLRDLQELSTILKNMRLRRGAIDFDFPEYKVILDPEGVPLRLEKRERTLAEQIVEESMLIANETVSCYLRDSDNPSVYRIHEIPEPERLDMMRTVLSSFNLPVPDSEHVKPADFQKLLETTKGTDEAAVVQTIALRSMQQARYATANAGHFGLASECYTHFTSPIRRYPDMMVHRLLARYLEGGKSADRDTFEKLCVHASEREVIAAEAERASIKYKMVEFMQDKIGQFFDGHISGMSDWGMYVELDETHIEGMVSLREMEDDLYQFDENRYEVYGRRKGRIFTLGDAVRIRVKRADLQRRQLDFDFVRTRLVCAGCRLRWPCGLLCLVCSMYRRAARWFPEHTVRAIRISSRTGLLWFHAPEPVFHCSSSSRAMNI